MSENPRLERWASHDLGEVDPDMVTQALATERDVSLPSALMSAIADDLDTLVTVAASGVTLDADTLERLVARCRLAAALAAKKEVRP